MIKRIKNVFFKNGRYHLELVGSNANYMVVSDNKFNDEFKKDLFVEYKSLSNTYQNISIEVFAVFNDNITELDHLKTDVVISLLKKNKGPMRVIDITSEIIASRKLSKPWTDKGVISIEKNTMALLQRYTPEMKWYGNKTPLFINTNSIGYVLRDNDQYKNLKGIHIGKKKMVQKRTLQKFSLPEGKQLNNFKPRKPNKKSKRVSEGDLSESHTKMIKAIADYASEMGIKYSYEYNNIDILLMGKENYIVEVKSSPTENIKALGQLQYYSYMANFEHAKILITTDHNELKEEVFNSYGVEIINFSEYKKLINSMK